MPLISVCVAAYNIEKYIAACIDSILDQNFSDYEVVVVDNGSDDRTVEICEEYALLYPSKVRFFSLPKPTMIVRAHIYAVEQASGEYIHLIDGDDCVAKDYLINISQIIEDEKPELIMGGFKCIIEDGASNYMDAEIDKSKINHTQVNDAIEYIFSLEHFNRYVWRFVVSRRLFNLVKFNKNIAHLTMIDGLKSTVWLINTKSVYYYDGPFYYYRRRIGSTVLSKNNPMTLDFIRTIIATTQIILEIDDEAKRKKCYELEATQIEWYLKLFVSGYDSLTFDELFELSEYLVKNSGILAMLKNYNSQEIDKFYQAIKDFGYLPGLIVYVEAVQAKFYTEVVTCKKKDIYIFPAGKFAENTYRLLKKWNFNVIGFLDNDEMKNSHEFMNLPCRLPDSLRLLENTKKSDKVVVISTIYKNLIDKFENQLLDMNIDKKNIFIRE